MKIGVISLGCAKNLVDTENVLGLLRQSNQEIVTSYEKECEREIEKELEKEHDVK